MGNTLDMNKIRDDHQARSERLMQASAFHVAAAHNYSDELMLKAYAEMLKELALIWREEATAVMEANKRGAKGTAESLRDCATRVSAVAVAMERYGLPGDDEAPKDSPVTDAAISTASSAPATGAVQGAGETGPKESASTPIDSGVPGVTPVIPQSTPGTAAPHPSDELQRDLKAVDDGALTAADFRRKWPDPIHEDQMVEFLKNRRAPVSDDPAGDFLRDLGHKPNAGDWTKLDSQLNQELALVPALKDGFVTPQVAAQIRAEAERQTVHVHPGELVGYASSGGVLDTSKPAMLAVQWSDGDAARVIENTFGLEPGDIGFNPAEFTIGTAAAPPAWLDLPEVAVYELTDDPATWNPSPGHSSVSQADLAGECPMKWWLSKRRGAPERPNWALVGGKAFHECVRLLETYDQANLQPVDQLWKTAFTLAIEETERENPLFPQATWHASNKGKEGRAWWDLDGPEMVHRYLQWRENFRAQGWELLSTKDGREVVELEFMAWLGGGPVKGYIDSAWYHPGKNMIVIIDWKSGKNQPADYFQQATYRHALEPLVEPSLRADLPRTWAGAFWDAREGALGKLVHLDERHPKAEVEMRLSGPRRIDAAGLYMPNVNTGYGGCNSCSLKRSCPVGSRIGKGEIS
jgi:hypothetical protein